MGSFKITLLWWAAGMLLSILVSAPTGPLVRVRSPSLETPHAFPSHSPSVLGLSATPVWFQRSAQGRPSCSLVWGTPAAQMPTAYFTHGKSRKPSCSRRVMTRYVPSGTHRVQKRRAALRLTLRPRGGGLELAFFVSNVRACSLCCEI